MKKKYWLYGVGVAVLIAAEKLSAMGYTNIVECGGILDWTGDIVTKN